MAATERIPTGHRDWRTGKNRRQGRQGQTAQAVACAGGLNSILRFSFLVVLACSGLVGLGPIAAAFGQEPRSVRTGNFSGRPDFESSSSSDTASAASTGDASSAADSNAVPERGIGTTTRDQQLKLSDVIASVYQAYPAVEQARLEQSRTEGMVLESWGAFDTKALGYGISEPTGFYRNNQQGLGLARQTWWGGYLSAGYRLGRGDFQPWYKERETNKGGEFKIGLGMPLLQGRAIDPSRVAVFQASLATQTVNPQIRQTILEVSRDAASVYWDWIATGAVLDAQKELLDLAETRGEQFREGVEAGKFAEVDLVFNRQLIAERSGKVLETEQKFRASGFKLALFLRDETGQPMVPDDSWLPHSFPVIEPVLPLDFAAELAAALNRRPEPQLLQLELQQLGLEQRLACNNLLPRVDLLAEASQDMGTPASTINDKGPFELVVGLQGEVPLQRRKARGKIQSTEAKLAQVTQKLRLQSDKIGTEIRMAWNALELTSRIVDQAEAALRASVDTLDRYRFAFEKGKADLIYLNLLETKLNETEIKLIEAQRNWFIALADLQAILGLDPLDQAQAVATLPESGRPGPGNLPDPAVMPDEPEPRNGDRDPAERSPDEDAGA